LKVGAILHPEIENGFANMFVLNEEEHDGIELIIRLQLGELTKIKDPIERKEKCDQIEIYPTKKYHDLEELQSYHKLNANFREILEKYLDKPHEFDRKSSDYRMLSSLIIGSWITRILLNIENTSNLVLEDMNLKKGEDDE
jgi:hypothetical protein